MHDYTHKYKGIVRDCQLVTIFALTIKNVFGSFTDKNNIKLNSHKQFLNLSQIHVYLIRIRFTESL